MGLSMPHMRKLGRLASAPIAIFLIGAADTAPPTVINIQIGTPIPITVNGEPIKVLVDPDAPSIPMINPEHQDRLKLKKSMIQAGGRVGPQTSIYSTDVVEIDAGTGPYKRRAAWSIKDVKVEGADGMFGPSSLSYDQVVFHLRPAAPGETIISFPLKKSRWSQASTTLMIGEDEIPVTFTATRAETLMTASTGALLSEQYGGYFSGETRTTMVRYGIVRPIRPLSVRTPFLLGRLTLSNLAVRTSDNGDSSGIDDNALPTAAIDDDEEIVVTAKSKKNKPKHGIIVGRDALSHCSTITYDYRTKQIRLSCL